MENYVNCSHFPGNDKMIASFKHLPISRLEFRLRACEEFEGYPILGSALRGAFGNGLKFAACTVGHGNCNKCLLSPACHYTNIFEPVAEKNVPRPFVFTVPAPPLNPRLSADNSLRIRVAAGAEMPFGMTLIGNDTIRRLPYFIAGVTNLAASGLGMSRKRFFLSDATSGGRSLINTETAGRPTVVSLAEECESRIASMELNGKLALRMITPVWLREDREFVEKPDFFHYVKVILKRLRNLFEYYADGPFDIRINDFLDASREVQTLNETIWKHDFDFYSNRRRRKENQSGLLGEMVFVGDGLSVFLPLLIAGELLHIGSKTTFGLGRIAVSGKFAK